MSPRLLVGTISACMLFPLGMRIDHVKNSLRDNLTKIEDMEMLPRGGGHIPLGRKALQKSLFTYIPPGAPDGETVESFLRCPDTRPTSFCQEPLFLKTTGERSVASCMSCMGTTSGAHKNLRMQYPQPKEAYAPICLKWALPPWRCMQLYFADALNKFLAKYSESSNFGDAVIGKRFTSKGYVMEAWTGSDYLKEAQIGQLPERTARRKFKGWKMENWQGLPVDPASALDLENAVKGLYRWNEFQGVCVWPQPIHDERQTSSMVNLAIGTAQRFAVLTSYGTKPEQGPFRDDSTSVALWLSILNRVFDPVTIVFAYNKDSWKQTGFTKTSTSVEKGLHSGWQQAVLQPLLERCKLCQRILKALRQDTSRLKAKIYFAELSPHGPFGSWHTKFCINDRGMFSTTGWSLGNKAKPNWVDAGLIAIDKRLAYQEAHHFVNKMLLRSKQDVNTIRRAVVQDAVSAQAHGEFVFDFVDVDKAELDELKNNILDTNSEEWNSPTIPFASTEFRKAGFTEQESLVPFVRARSAVSLRNHGHKGGDFDYRPRRLDGPYRGAFDRMKPINLAIWLLFQMAEPGDTVWLRCKSSIFYLPTGDDFFDVEPPIQWEWARAAARRGVTVYYLATIARNEEATTCGPSGPTQARQRMYMGESLMKDLKSDYETTGKQASDFTDQQWRYIVSTRVQVRAMNVNGTSGSQAECDHAKVYALEKRQTGDVWVGVGTWNNDMQSMRGSNENILFVSDTTKRDASSRASSVFHNFLESWWEAGTQLPLWPS